MTRQLTFAALCISFGSVEMAAQSAPDWDKIRSLPVGTQVLVAPNQPRNVKGKIDAVTDDSIVVKAGKGPETLRRTDIEWISVRVGRRKKHVLSGLKWGTIIGAGIGAGVTAICISISGNDGECYAFIPAGALDVAGLGALFGAIMPGGEWREIYRRSLPTAN